MAEDDKGNQRFAIFDVDETLIYAKSIFSFLKYALEKKFGGEKGSLQYEEIFRGLSDLRRESGRLETNREFYRVFSGWPLAELRELARQWFHQCMEMRTFFIPAVVRCLKDHVANGDKIILLSGSAEFIIQPVANFLKVEHVLAMSLGEDNDGVATGEISGVQTIGEGKAYVLNRFLSENGEARAIAGYGDHESDIPFMELCDAAFVVAPLGMNPTWGKDWPRIYHKPQSST